MPHRWLLVFFVLFAAALLSWAVLAVPVRDGDGMEYWYQVESLARHLSPELREDDELAVVARFPGPEAVLSDPFAEIDIPACPPVGYETTRDGRLYAAHFWAYPLSAVPARWALGVAGGNVMASLQVTNAVWFLTALGVVLFAWPVTTGKKLAFVALAFVGPPLAYLPFTGAEIFSWANAVLAIVALDQKKYARCSLFACIGATQNPPLALLGVVATLLAACQRQWRPAILAALAGMVAVLPFAFYLLHFGKLSLIVGSATSTANISVARSLSMIFDLNQGLCGYVPLLSLAAGLGLILGRSSAAIAVSVAVAGMAAAMQTQSNWNGGGAGMHRYLVWMMPLLAWIAAEGLSHALKIGFASSALVLHLTLFLALPADRLSHLEQRPLARWVLRQAPFLYSPLPEIFIERQAHAEFGDSLRELPRGFARPNGEVVKVLVVRGCEGRLREYFVVKPDYLEELLAQIAAADTPTYIHPPVGAMRTNPGALMGVLPDHAERARPRWR